MTFSIFRFVSNLAFTPTRQTILPSRLPPFFQITNILTIPLSLLPLFQLFVGFRKLWRFCTLHFSRGFFVSLRICYLFIVFIEYMAFEVDKKKESTIFIKNLPDDITTAVFSLFSPFMSSNSKALWTNTVLSVVPLL